MHTIPIAHWAGGRIPLFEIDFRDGPVDQVFPDTAAGLAAVLPSGAVPSHLYLFDAQPGNNELDRVGAYDLVPTNNPLQYQLATGIYTGGSWSGKRCCEFGRGTNQHLRAQNASWFDFALNSFAFLGVIRGYDNNVSSQVFSKYAPPLAPSYQLTMNATGLLNWSATGAGTNGHAGHLMGGWYPFLSVMHRGNAQQYSASSWDGNTVILSPTSLTNVSPFLIGSDIAGTNSRWVSSRFQIAYLAVFEGAEALKINSLVAAQADIAAFWRNGYPRMDIRKADGVLINNVDLAWLRRDAVTARNSTASYVDANKTTIVDFARQAPIWQYDSRFSHATKLGQYSGDYNLTSLLQRTDDFDDALWVKTNMTVSAVQANCAISPTGMKIANLLTATNNNAYVHYAFATGGANFDYCPGVWVKRGDAEVSDVTGHLDVYNASGGVTLYTTPFTATDTWQHIPINGGAYITLASINVQFRIYIDATGRSIHAYRAHFIKDTRKPVTGQWFAAGNTIDSSNTYMKAVFGAPGQWIKSDRGEVEITIVFDSAEPATGDYRYPWDSASAGGGNIDRRIFRIRDAAGLYNGQGYSFDSAGLAADILDGNVIDWALGENTIVYKWDAVNPSYAGRHSELVINGVVYTGALAGWTWTDLVTELYFACALNTSYPARGTISRVRIYDD